MFARRRLAIAATLALLGSVAFAQSSPTADEAKAVTLKAAALIAEKGVDAARPILHQEGEFRHGEIYVNVINLEGRWLVYPPRPAGEGMNMINVKDPDGKLIVQEVLKVAQEKDEGWVEYRWANPASNRIEPKLTYVKRVPGVPAVAYVGIYK
jgi:signal transduction histidine kinase